MNFNLFNFNFILILVSFAKWCEPAQAQEVIYVPRTNVFARWPFFGSFRNILRAVRPNVHVGRKSDYRSDFDENYVNYHGSQIWKILFKQEKSANNVSRTEDMQRFIAKYGNEIWNINQDGIDVLIDFKNSAKGKEFMAKKNLTYNIMIDDLEVAIDDTYAEVNNTNPEMPWLEREGTIMNWNRYHDMGDITQFMQFTLDQYADLTEIIQIGLTNNKRPLEVLRISNGNPNNWAVFIDAGLQGRDWLSPAAVTLAISKLTYLWNSPHSSMMRNIDWYFLPVVNPDGYQYSRLTDRLWTKNRHFDASTNCFGVNLDRNFEYEWGGAGSTASACKNLYRGPKKFSEPETKSIKSFLMNMKSYLGAYISFGGYGQEIAYPWGDADFVTNNQEKLHQIGRKAKASLRKLNQAEYRVGSSYRLKLARAGNSADWVQYSISPKYVYSVFLKDLGRYGYLMPPQYIVESGEEVYEFMKVIALALYGSY